MVGGEGVEDLVGAPLKRGCRGGGVGLAWVVACGRVQRIPSFAGLGMSCINHKKISIFNFHLSLYSMTSRWVEEVSGVHGKVVR